MLKEYIELRTRKLVRNAIENIGMCTKVLIRNVKEKYRYAHKSAIKKCYGKF